ncbi:uncharacterized protein LOC130776426 isoform X3 [Actinidia eriantha]|uniref:uncharacterized protein LOC130776426 isoform X3 n=1 Tax=Actinidia eriantha TaxID=165200 RepID=UPI0025891066|nr:uncharacterized protein LOC130776426 isoform X3 [Actinidia eriantha]
MKIKKENDRYIMSHASYLFSLLSHIVSKSFRTYMALFLLFSLFVDVLRFFQGGDPSQERNHFLEVATSSLSTLARFPWGSRSLTDSLGCQENSAVDPLNRLQLFEFEACPFCRRVREALTELDLSVEIYPCPKGSIRHREMVKSVGGKEQFPFLVDPNTGISMYESSKIVKYLFQQYGEGRSPSIGLLESTKALKCIVIAVEEPSRGMLAIQNNFKCVPRICFGRGMSLWEKAITEPPCKKLELFAYENNPYARIVREALCELELPYIHQTVGKGSPRINLLREASGSNECLFQLR